MQALSVTGKVDYLQKWQVFGIMTITVSSDNR